MECHSKDTCDTEKIMKSGKNWQGLQFHSKQSGKLSLYIIIKFRLYNHSRYGKTEKYIFFLQLFMWHGTFLVELWGFCGELILPNFPLHQVVYPWGSIEHVGFQYGAWFTAMPATVPLIRNSNHMSFCDLLLCFATSFINKVERSFPP